MPSKRVNHPRKTERGSYTAELMREAVQLVLEGHSARRIAKEKGLAFKTLLRYLLLSTFVAL